MNSQVLYQNDPFTLEFQAVVTEKMVLPDGRPGVILDQTYFYPTGGGQEYDTGSLGEAQVIEVYKEGEPARTVHVLDQEIPLGPALARIDRERRLRHMQHHTAQHLLSGCFLRLFDLETLSAHINGYTASTIDLPVESLSKAQLERAEDLANQLIFENHPVKTYFVSPADLEKLPIRKQPKVTENIRIVEIEAFDWSPCGGTHCLSTGSIGLLKILKTDRQNDKTRVHFNAGLQALEYFRELHEIVTSLAGGMSIHPRDLPEAVQRQAEVLRSAEKELQGLRGLRVQLEARELYDRAESAGSRRVILAAFEGRTGQELRALGDELRKMDRSIAVLASYDGSKIACVTSCAPDSGLSAREILSRLLTSLGGRGGGDAALAQGGGTATPEQFRGIKEQARSILQAML